MGQLRHPIHELGYLIAEVTLNVLKRDAGIFHGIMQQPSSHHYWLNVHFSQDDGNRHAMRDIGLSRSSFLFGVRIFRKVVRLNDELSIYSGIIVRQNI